MKKFIRKFANENGEPTELTMRISYGAVGFILSCSVLIVYSLFTTELQHSFGMYG